MKKAERYLEVKSNKRCKERSS